MIRLTEEIRDFAGARERERAQASQRVALHLLCGLDLETLLVADETAQRSALLRIERALARERMKGLGRHWSYDLNRHIALKQAADTIRAAGGAPCVAASYPQTTSGARKRRRRIDS